LNLAETPPVEVFTAQAGSPVVSIINERGSAEVSWHPILAVEKPVPVTLTSVAAPVGGPVIGGDPLVRLNVTAAVTVKLATADLSPWSGVTTTL